MGTSISTLWTSDDRRIVSPSAKARRASVARHAEQVGAYFDLQMGHHLGLVERTIT
jgi:hypothetical protein